MGIYEKLTKIQNELKAPKNQYNDFGKYKYRSCEDILEALKPLLKKHNVTLSISDTIEQVGERYYVKAVVRLVDCEDNSSIENTAYSRESETAKGFDASQLTGATSSYARKYALNGLFLIDDTKDADTNEYQGKVRGESADDIQQNKEWMAQGKDLIDEIKVKSLEKVCKNHKMPEAELAKHYNHKKLSELTMIDYLDFVKTGEDFMKKWDENHAG